MKSTLRRTYFKCIRRDLDSTFALGLSLPPLLARLRSFSYLIYSGKQKRFTGSGKHRTDADTIDVTGKK